MKEVDQLQGDEVPSTSANIVNRRGWRTCPVCDRGATPSPESDKFLLLIHHLVEHETGGLRPGYVEIYVRDDLDLFHEQLGLNLQRIDARTCERMLVKAARRFLPIISEWLEQALEKSEELRSIRDAGIPTAQQLCRIARSLSEHPEQRGYLLQHELISESMAGAEWNLTPKTSREYIRREKPRVRPLIDKRKTFERRLRKPDGRVNTSRDHES